MQKKHHYIVKFTKTEKIYRGSKIQHTFWMRSLWNLINIFYSNKRHNLIPNLHTICGISYLGTYASWPYMVLTEEHYLWLMDELNHKKPFFSTLQMNTLSKQPKDLYCKKLFLNLCTTTSFSYSTRRTVLLCNVFINQCSQFFDAWNLCGWLARLKVS